MTDAFIQLPTDGTGKKLASDEIAQGADSVHYQRVQIHGKDAAGSARTANPVVIGMGDGDNVRVAAAGPIPFGSGTPQSQFIAGTPSDFAVTHAPASNTVATATRTAQASRRYCITSIMASFSSGPSTNQLLQVKDGTTILWQGYVSGAPFSQSFPHPLMCSTNSDAVATLAAGGIGVSGAVCIAGFTVIV